MKRKKNKDDAAEQSKSAENPKFEVLTFRSPTGAYRAPAKLLHKPEDGDNGELSLEEEPEPGSVEPLVFTAGIAENTPQFAARELRKTTMTRPPVFSADDMKNTLAEDPAALLKRVPRNTLKTAAPQFFLDDESADVTEELPTLPDPALAAGSTIKTPVPTLEPQTLEDEESDGESFIVLTNPKNKS